MIPDYTLVCGVDRKHLQQLALVWPTWRRHKPSLLSHPMIVFRDRKQVEDAEVRAVVDHPNLSVYVWPLGDVSYGESSEDKWEDGQRYKMLAGFVYVPALFVNTPYWLKLDTDTVASGVDDWIDPGWFEGRPAIVSHPWPFTKPPDQMLRLDEWAAGNDVPMLEGTEPLDLAPPPGWSRVRHQRIISWCAFFGTDFSKRCATSALLSCGPYHLPVRSQDGYLWYMAKRSGAGIVRTNMKNCGWVHRTTMSNIKQAVEEAMGYG